MSAAPSPHAQSACPERRRVAGLHRGRDTGRLSMLAALLLVVGTGCSMLGPIAPSSNDATYSVDPSIPFVVVTVGGSPAAKAIDDVAPTIPDSTPLPRIALPTPDPAATPRPAASPSLTRQGSAAAQAARPPANPAPAGSPVPANRTP